MKLRYSFSFLCLRLLELIDKHCHGSYIKLIASCLDYTKPALSRILLNKVLSSTSEVCIGNLMLYYLRVLIEIVFFF